MKDFANKVTQKAKAGLDSANSFLSDLPVLGEYQDKERRREVDRKLREAITVSLESARKQVVETERMLMNKGKLTDLPYVDVAATRLQILIDRVRTAPSGYAGFFDLERIREPELEKLRQFDERIAASIPDIDKMIAEMQSLIASGKDYSEALMRLIRGIDDLGERMDHRREAIRAASDDVAALADESTAPVDPPAEATPADESNQ